MGLAGQERRLAESVSRPCSANDGSRAVGFQPLREHFAAQNYPVEYRRITRLGNNYASRNMDAIHLTDAFESIEVRICKNASLAQSRCRFAEWN